MMRRPEDIIHFWFVEKGEASWWAATDAFDAEIRERYEDTAIALAAQSKRPPHPWEDRTESSLALILALDQFPRNMYRNTPAAFAWDHLALDVAKRMIGKGWDLSLPETKRHFVYMPLMHSEKLEDQNFCCALIESRMSDENALHHAREHRDLIQKFGRFPHRNDILGRQSSLEEMAHLENGGYQP